MAESPLKPAYLMVGTDEYMVKKALDRLDRRLAATGADPEFNREVVDGPTIQDPVLLRSSLDTLPFAGDFRLVVVLGVDRAPKAAVEAIVSYLADPCPTTVLAMTCAKMAKTTRLYKAVARIDPKAVLDFSAKKRWELPTEVAKMARARGLSIDQEAAELLVRTLGESTLLLDNELAKLGVALAPRTSVTADDVRALVVRVAEVKPWDFLDAMSKRDPAGALQMLALMPSQSLIGLFTLTCARIRELITAKTLAGRGVPGTLAAELGMQSWQVKNHVAWSRNYDMRELVAALRSAPDCESALKSSPDKELAFMTWFLSFCTPRR